MSTEDQCNGVGPFHSLDNELCRATLIEDDPIAVVDELLALRLEVKTLRAKVKSGVEAAHYIQKAYYDHQRPKSLSWYDRDLEEERLCEKDEAADYILTAMEELDYYQTLQKEDNAN